MPPFAVPAAGQCCAATAATAAKRVTTAVAGDSAGPGHTATRPLPFHCSSAAAVTAAAVDIAASSVAVFGAVDATVTPLLPV